MRLAYIAREAWRNTTTGTSHAGMLAVLAFVVVGLLQAVDAISVSTLDRQVRDLRAAGGDVTIISAEGHIDGSLCTGLGSLDGVLAAGAVRKVKALQLSSLPGRGLPAYEVTPHVPAIFHGRDYGEPHAGVTVSEEAADLLMAAPATGGSRGSVLNTSLGDAEVGSVYSYPPDGRLSGFGFAALIPTADDGRFDECWVKQWPATQELQTHIRATLVPGTPLDTEIDVYPWNPSVGLPQNAHEAFTSRPTRWAPLCSTTFMLLVSIGVVRMRKLELVSHMHLGVPTKDILRISLTEAIVWLGPMAVGGIAAAGLYAELGAPDDYSTSFVRNALCPSLAFIAGLAGTSIGAISLREEKLFDYFKSR